MADDARDATLRRMDRRLEALTKTREHVADVTRLAEMAGTHLEEGRFEEASACLRPIEQRHPTSAGYSAHETVVPSLNSEFDLRSLSPRYPSLSVPDAKAAPDEMKFARRTF